MNKIFSLGLLIGLIMTSCTDPNLIGLEVQPESDNIIISSANFEGITSSTESIDSMPTSRLYNENLILGQINDPVFGLNQGSFCTNITLGSNPEVDSVVLSYTYSGYYGDKAEFDDVEVNIINEDIYKDTIYYSNSFEIIPGGAYWVDSFSLSNDTINPFLSVKLKNEFAQEIFKESILIDNETFLQEFKGISVLAHTTNTMLYLNPNGSNSFLKIYYHNDDSDSLSLDFKVGDDAARINLFNEKAATSLIEDDSRIYLQSMAGYEAKISIGNIDSLKQVLENKEINKVELTFSVESNSQNYYEANNRLYLVRVAVDEGNHAPLLDHLEQGEFHFGGWLDDDQYKFNITRYFIQLLQDDSLIKELYLQPYNPLFDQIDSGRKVNANRTILEKDIKLKIYYSEL